MFIPFVILSVAATGSRPGGSIHPAVLELSEILPRFPFAPAPVTPCAVFTRISGTDPPVLPFHPRTTVLVTTEAGITGIIASLVAGFASRRMGAGKTEIFRVVEVGRSPVSRIVALRTISDRTVKRIGRRFIFMTRKTVTIITAVTEPGPFPGRDRVTRTALCRRRFVK